MAAKDLDRNPSQSALQAAFVGEVADLWFHSLIALAHYNLRPADVLAELERRGSQSGLEEFAARKSQQREKDGT